LGGIIIVCLVGFGLWARRKGLPGGMGDGSVTPGEQKPPNPNNSFQVAGKQFQKADDQFQKADHQFQKADDQFQKADDVDGTAANQSEKE
jgi:hypothetical protein